MWLCVIPAAGLWNAPRSQASKSGRSWLVARHRKPTATHLPYSATSIQNLVFRYDGKSPRFSVQANNAWVLRYAQDDTTTDRLAGKRDSAVGSARYFPKLCAN